MRPVNLYRWQFSHFPCFFFIGVSFVQRGVRQRKHVSNAFKSPVMVIVDTKASGVGLMSGVGQTMDGQMGYS